jgi:hypothetical protein
MKQITPCSPRFYSNVLQYFRRVVIIFLIIISLTSCQSSCEKNIAKGTIINANGFVIDSVKNKRIPNATLYLFGGHQPFGSPIVFSGPALDSTVSDQNGNFQLQYTAEGNSLDYALGVTRNALYGFNQYPMNYVADPFHLLYVFKGATQLTNIAISARELNYALINLKVLSNPYDSLYFSISSPEYYNLGSNYLFIGNTIDTSILIRCLPNSTYRFFYSISAKQLIDSGYVRERIDSSNITLVDTTIITTTINSTYDFPLQPSGY